MELESIELELWPNAITSLSLSLSIYQIYYASVFLFNFFLFLVGWNFGKKVWL